MMQLVNLHDPRGGGMRRHHIFKEIIVIAILAMICGAETYNEMEDFGKNNYDWLSTFMFLPYGIPSHDTINRAIASIDPKEFERNFRLWNNKLAQMKESGDLSKYLIAIDGKAIKRSVVNGKYPIIVSAWDGKTELTIAQEEVSEKSNEITAVPRLLDGIDIRNKVVTLDAMGCQKSIAKKIIERGGDYMLGLKGNHSNMYDDLFFFMVDTIKNNPDAFEYHKTIESGHGRIEKRQCWQSNDISWLSDYDKWPGLRSVCLVESKRTINKKTTTEKRLYLSSLPIDSEMALSFIRGHWGIENRVHYKLDVALNEDYSRARSGNAARNLSTVRRIVLNVISICNQQLGVKRFQKRLAGNIDCLKEIVEKCFG